MKIHHRPILDTKRVCELYSQKDGVPVTYVCTSAPNLNAAYAADIFYRETPHPEFGNRYFGLYRNPNFSSDGTIMITNADMIEDLEFGMKEHNGEWHYSQHRHDFYTIGDVSLDGGRAYFRCVGNVSTPTKFLKVKDGEFVDAPSARS
jgi:hypothetical protein